MMKTKTIIIIIIFIKTHVWDPLIAKWFFSLQLKSKNENTKSILKNTIHIKNYNKNHCH